MSTAEGQVTRDGGGELILLVVNGGERLVPVGTTVTGLLAELAVGLRPVLVERNGEALFPRDFPATVLGDGDRVEIVRMVAGG
jgi:sulfur carrier protein